VILPNQGICPLWVPTMSYRPDRVPTMGDRPTWVPTMGRRYQSARAVPNMSARLVQVPLLKMGSPVHRNAPWVLGSPAFPRDLGTIQIPSLKSKFHFPQQFSQKNSEPVQTYPQPPVGYPTG